MNYGIDIDDTISDSASMYIKYGHNYTKNILKRDTMNKLEGVTSHHYLEEIFEWNKEELKEFLEIYYEYVIKNVEVKNGVVEVLNKIKEKNDNIYLITARYEMPNSNIEKETLEWLKNNEIPFDELIMNARNKKSICEKYNIDVFIDDSYVNCKCVSELNNKVYLMTSNTNQKIDVSNDKIERVKDWKDFKTKI